MQKSVTNKHLSGVHAFTGDPVYAHKEDAGFMDVCAYEKWIKDITNF